VTAATTSILDPLRTSKDAPVHAAEGLPRRLPLEAAFTSKSSASKYFS
jgi:hypothetical protein